MKDVFKQITSGVVGGLLVMGVIFFTDFGKTENTSRVEAKAIGVSNSFVQPLVTTGPNFVTAAEKGTKAVVHISAKESIQLAQERMQNQRRRNPYEDFFSLDDFFGGGDFFGRNFYQPKNGSGSGVIYSSDGYIVTNNHVVGFADEIVVTTQDGKEYNATKVGTDPSTDLAVIKINASQDLPSITLDDSDKVRVGEWVLAVGNPFDYLTSTVTAGIVSAKGRDLDIIRENKPIEEFIQTDAAVNPGNSGGALLNDEGNLVGINTAIATPTGVYAGYSFAIPSNLVKRIVTDIIENGDIERANLGVAGYDIREDDIEKLGLKVKNGFYVEEVIPRSAAQFGGILPGDVITGIDGKKITGFDDLAAELKFAKVGDRLNVDINRNGKQKTIKVQLKKGI